MGYRIVKLYKTDDNLTNVLQIEGIAQHDESSLYMLVMRFEELAKEFNLESYDGLDVGPVKNDESVLFKVPIS
jgi:hypothetical protein